MLALIRFVPTTEASAAASFLLHSRFNPSTTLSSAELPFASPTSTFVILSLQRDEVMLQAGRQDFAVFVNGNQLRDQPFILLPGDEVSFLPDDVNHLPITFLVHVKASWNDRDESLFEGIFSEQDVTACNVFHGADRITARRRASTPTSGVNFVLLRRASRRSNVICLGIHIRRLRLGLLELELIVGGIVHRNVACGIAGSSPRVVLALFASLTSINSIPDILALPIPIRFSGTFATHLGARSAGITTGTIATADIGRAAAHFGTTYCLRCGVAFRPPQESAFPALRRNGRVQRGRRYRPRACGLVICTTRPAR
ncbi:hypothetical protein OC835_007869, partial [Tilletia horrida]